MRLDFKWKPHSAFSKSTTRLRNNGWKDLMIFVFHLGNICVRSSLHGLAFSSVFSSYIFCASLQRIENFFFANQSEYKKNRNPKNL